mmetsp:Transcript_35279/g.88885  ORF Transcript_35279/g.88885 Transcript_35279/m.88885 type:complete len:181 (-) Transcript_35279:447-989(-)
MPGTLSMTPAQLERSTTCTPASTALEPVDKVRSECLVKASGITGPTKLLNSKLKANADAMALRDLQWGRFALMDFSVEIKFESISLFLQLRGPMRDGKDWHLDGTACDLSPCSGNGARRLVLMSALLGRAHDVRRDVIARALGPHKWLDERWLSSNGPPHDLTTRFGANGSSLSSSEERQ